MSYEGPATEELVASLNVRTFAIACGELHGLAVRKLKPIREGAANWNEKANAQLDYLERKGAITAADKVTLTSVMTGLDRADESRLANLTELHHELIDRSDSSPLAIVIAGVAVNSVSLEQSFVTFGAVAHADVDGALVGGILGVEVGGPWGLLIGGVAGGAGASIAQAL